MGKLDRAGEKKAKSPSWNNDQNGCESAVSVKQFLIMEILPELQFFEGVSAEVLPCSWFSRLRCPDFENWSGNFDELGEAFSAVRIICEVFWLESATEETGYEKEGRV